jgi:allophanate hydrolase
LKSAGAVLIGATNLDQFATGLVGVRSPYGAVRHAFLPDRISGGSSSGSAVSVALGIVDFALGTDTAGSGRVPAAFHGLFGIKPTRGVVSNTGVLPACRSLDCVTVFARDLLTAQSAFDVMAQVDHSDSLTRELPAVDPTVSTRKIGIPMPGQLGELADGWQIAFDKTVSELGNKGFELIEIDIRPLLDVAQMLYDGAFVAERYTAVGAFIDAHPDEVDPTVRQIISSAREIPAHKLYADFEKLDAMRVVSDEIFAGLDALILPTTTFHPTLADLVAEPIAANSRLGRFTNFANLLDLAAIAVPAGKVGEECFGVQLIGAAFTDKLLARIANQIDAGLND